MSEPIDRFREYLAMRLKQQEQDKKVRATRDVAQLESQSRKYKADRDLMIKGLEVQADASKERLGVFVDLVTQLNKYDEQNPLDKFLTPNPKEYYPTDGKGKEKIPVMYYIDKNGDEGEKIPQAVAIQIIDRNKRKSLTRLEITKGIKSVNKFGEVTNRESEHKSRLKTDRSGKPMIDNKTIQEVQDDINSNPTITLPDEQDNDKTIGVPTPQSLQERTGTTTVSDLIKANKERGIAGNSNLKSGKSNAGGFNAGSSPNQFLGTTPFLNITK